MHFRLTKPAILALLGIILGPCLIVQASYAQATNPFAFIKFVHDKDKAHQINVQLDQMEWKANAAQALALTDSFLASGDYFDDYLILTQHFKLKLTAAQKEKLIARIEEKLSQELKDWEFKSLRSLQDEIRNGIPTKVPGHFVEQEFRVRALDLEQDGEVDMILFPRTYFGPTPGYYIYARQGKTFKYLFDNSGEFWQITQTPQSLTMRYVVNIIDAAEPVILLNTRYDFESKEVSLGPKQYYGSQLDMRENLQSPQTFELIQATALRNAPQIDDTPLKTDEYPEYYNSACLRGNVVADLDLPSSGVLLAEEGDWVLVAFDPKANVKASSLRHGMDDFHIENGEYKQGPAVKPYLCGWIPKSALKP